LSGVSELAFSLDYSKIRNTPGGFAVNARNVTREEWTRLADVCHRYYVKGDIQRRIAKDLDVNASWVSRALRQARELGIVRFSIEMEPPAVVQERVPGMERELVNRFQLVRAIVVDMPTESGNQPYSDDRLHEALGYACANFLRTWLRPGDHIGVGGGRGAYFTAKYLAETAADPEQKSLVDMTITSLTGSMSTTPWESPAPVVDADQAAALAANAFPGATHRLLNAPVAPPLSDRDAYLESGSAQVLLEKLWERRPNTFVPNVGLVGIGTLAGEHRFCHQGDHLDALAVLEPKLKELRKAIKPSEKRGYYPVGDICNTLFFVEPALDEQALDEDTKNQIKSLLKAINQMVISASFDQLGMIRKKGNLVAVAGGPVKFDAISSLVARKDATHRRTHHLDADVSVDVLCTDANTADRLLRRAASRT
jgi:DNA-binding transcriptional regulator LsrR (DeoR family)